MTAGVLLAPPSGRPAKARLPLLDDTRVLAVVLLAPMLLWIAAFFVVPVALMVWNSFAARGFAPYAVILTSPLYRKVLLTTFEICVVTTACCLLLGYPVAYAMTTARPAVRKLLLVFVVLPYWLDLIVRSYSWMILLGRRGLVNQLAIDLGLTENALPLLYNLFSVCLGMVQILLPLTILTLFSAMLRIDPKLTDAASIHGASRWRAFATVFLPLSLPGVYAAGLLVFVSALGFYVTPALLGGPEQTMISQTIMVIASDLMDWPLASAAGVLLLIVTTILLLVYSRFFRIDRMLGGVAR